MMSHRGAGVRAWFRFANWPLRAKMAMLLLVVSVVPLTIAGFLDIRQARARLIDETSKLLAARADQLVDRLDMFHQGYEQSVSRLGRFPHVIEFCEAPEGERDRLSPELRRLLAVYPASDRHLRDAAILDAHGIVRQAADQRAIGTDLSIHGFVREALRGAQPVVSDIFVTGQGEDEQATIAYLAPILDSDQHPIGLTAFFVRAEALWTIARAAQQLAGTDSYAVLFDHRGIRLAHTASPEAVFHPAGTLDPATIDALVAEHRFGLHTRELLADVRGFPEQFERARADVPDTSLFRGFTSIAQGWAYGLARRSTNTRWTLFYMIPVSTIDAEMAPMTWGKIAASAGIIALAFGAGLFWLVVTERLAARASALQDTRDTLEKTLHASEVRTRLILDAALDAVVTIDPQGIITGWNPRAESMFGWPYTEALGRLLSDTIVPPRNREAHKAGLQRFHETGEGPVLNRRIETTALHRDGYEFPVELAITPIRQGSEVTFSAFVRDITERKDAEAAVLISMEELRQAERSWRTQVERLHLLHQVTRAIGERQDLESMFRVLLQNLEDNLTIDFGCVCLVEPQTKTLNVVSVGARGRPIAESLALVEGTRVPVEPDGGLKRCLAGELVYKPDTRAAISAFSQRFADAGVRSLVVAPLLVESQVFGVLIALRRNVADFEPGDCEFLSQISEHAALAAHQAQLHTALQNAYDDLRLSQQGALQHERLRALGQMASGIAHDINNALSPAALFTESLLESEKHLSPDGRKALTIIGRAIDDVAQTVARLREFYRPRELQTALGPVDFSALSQEVIELTRVRWSDMPQQRGVVIVMRSDIARDLPPIKGVAGEIREALINLILNAADAMPEGGTITLRAYVAETSSPVTERPYRTVRIEVTDTGHGMSEETRRRCCEPFFTTKGERGTGLGMAMVYGIVQRHDAQIEIESEIGKGTTVRLSFPMMPAEGAAMAVGGITPDAARPRVLPLRILVVDDDPVLLKTLRDILMADGHTVVSAGGGQEGIDAFRDAHMRHEPFSVVLTDLGMPYVDGRKVALAIKEMSAETPVIMLTGWGQRLTAEGSKPLHVDRVLSKPPKLRELRATLADCARLRVG
jgi:PAS domain S-box-containing protein